MKGTFTSMIYKKGDSSAFVALLLLVMVALACNFKNDLDQANKLVSEANDELKKVKKIQDDSEAKIKELKSALDAKSVDGVRAALGDLIKMIDDGLGYGRTAADKVEEASKLKVDDIFKKYLDLKAQSFRTQIEAFEARKKAAQIFRDAYGSNDSARIEKAKEDFNKENEKYKRLLDQARDLSDEADKLQRENPDKIKTTSEK
jgi:chromosome segregation ATPase